MMSENNFESYISRKNNDAEGKVFALKSDVLSPLVYVKIPKNNKSMAPSFTISKTNLPGSTNITLGSKRPSQIGTSKSDHTRTVTVSPSQTCASKITMRAINSFTSSQIKVSTPNIGPASNICGKGVIRSNTVPSISGIVVSSVSGTVMSHSIQTSARTSLTLVNSGSALKLAPGLLRSPTLGQKHSPMVQVSKSSPKPLILHSKIVSAIKKSPNAARPSNINLYKQGLPCNRSNNALQSSSHILHSNISKAESLSKNQIPKKGGSASCLWSPPPLILQSGRNLKTVCKSGPTAISIVTGKGSHGNNTISVIPLARKGLSKRNMVNLKIANGQIVSDSSQKVKVDGMAPVCDSQSVSVTSLNHPQDSLLEDTLYSRSESEGSTTFFRRVSSDGSKPKDILEEAMCAMASDMDEISFVEGDSNDQYTSFTRTSHDSVGSVPKSKYANVGDNNRSIPNIIVPEQLPLLESTSVLLPGTSASLTSVSNLTETALPINSVQPAKAPIPISVPFTASTELPGLIIRTDSVTVRRKVFKDESRKESLKPDLSIIPILRNCSGENSPLKKNSRTNVVDLEKFADGKSTLDLLRGSFLNLSHVKNESNFAFENGKPSSSTTDNSPLYGFDEEAEAMEEQDFSKILKWQNGMGALTGSDLKFQVNEFGAIELVDDGAVDEIKEAVKDECKSSEELLDSNFIQNQAAPTIHIHHARKPNYHKDIKKDEEIDMVSDSDNLTKDFYDICCCKNCGCYGLCSEFLKEKGNSFCTMSCSEEYEVKEIEWNKEKIKLEKNKTKSKKFKPEDVDAVTKFETNVKENMEQLQQFLTPDKESKIDPVDTEVKLNLTWKGSKQSFSWVKYLEQCGKNKGLSRAAPLKLWTEPFPFGRNLFKAGMKVEGIDPQHQSLFCVMTVVDVIGHRIRLHFDGFSSINDFWCNDSSPNIFQVGWCEKNGHKLETPPGIANFTWKAYFDHCKVAPAPKQAFSTRSCTTVTTPSNFRIGMKLEAEDRKNGWTCVATVADVLDNRILVHFDGWEKAFDTWFDVNSPFIHPVGWCSTNGVFLFPPKDYSDPDNFSWHEYIQETNSVAVPARAFKTRAPKNFKKDMKIECVDKRNPMLVRVASIVDIKGYKLKIHFDGLSNEYDYWVDDDSPDIHPPTWSSKTGHPLQPPLNLDFDEKNIDLSNGCGTPGCKGYGHVKGLIYCTHHTSYGCPYSLQNLDKDWEALLPDRLEYSTFEKTHKASKQIVNLDESKPIPIDQDEEDLQKKRVRKRRKFFDELSPPECSKIKIPRMSSDELRIPVLSNFKSNNSSSCAYNTRNSVSSNENPILKPVSEEGRIDSIVHRSIFNPFYHPKPPVPRPLTLEAHKKFVAGKDVPKLESEKWTSKEVRQFISAIAGCSLVSKKFTEHKIDGKSLLMMTQQDLIDILGIKLGPAIKIMASIISVRNTL